MTLACPQCNSPVAREGQRFCYRCGNDLRSYYDSQGVSLEQAPAEQPAPEKAATESAAPEPAATGQTATEPAQAEANPASPNATDAHKAKDTSGMPPAPGTVVMESIENTSPPIKPGSETSQKAMLRILLPSGDVFDREIAHAETQMGKGPRNDLVIADAAVSTSHALIRAEGDGYTITDLGSRNGTFVNSERITETRRLNHGDVVGIGLSKLTFRMSDQSETGAIQRTEVMKAPFASVPPPLTEDSLAEALLSGGVVAKADVERLRGADARGRRLYRALVEERLASEEALRDLMSRLFQISTIDLRTAKIDEAAAASFPARIARGRNVFPVSKEADGVLLAVSDPTDAEGLKEAERSLRLPIKKRLATATEIAEQIQRRYAPKIIGVLPSGEKLQYPITKHEVEIGKASHNHIVLTDPTVSNTHAILLARDGGYSIVDLGSRNGTFVNGERLSTHARTLRHGDSIQFGQTVVTFRNPEETTENVTATLSPEALAEIRKRAGITDAGDTELVPPKEKAGALTVAPASAVAAAQPGSAVIQATYVDQEVEKGEKKKKKKDKEKKDDRLKAAYIGAVSRILAQIFAVLVSVGAAIYITTRPSSNPSTPTDQGVKSTSSTAKLVNPSAVSGFSGGTFEASGVVHVPGTNGVLFVADSKKSSVLWMTIDQAGRQEGDIKEVPLSVKIADPEGITHDNKFFYVVGGQGDPADGDQNAIVRFVFDPQSGSLQGPAEVIPNLRQFLFDNVPELKGEGEKPPAEGGLNIEGIAWDPVRTRLLLGLRSPQLNEQALIIPLKMKDVRGAFSADNLMLDGQRPIQVTLKGQGIRDIHYDNRLRSFLIISGMRDGVQKSDFQLWEWDGNTDQPREESVLDKGMKPEGITHARIGNKDMLFIVGDASKYLKLDYKD
jgi:pSer/pThr/pTyr-binding forkhead associated (FHA) protein